MRCRNYFSVSAGNRRPARDVERRGRWQRRRSLDRSRHGAVGQNLLERLPDHERQRREQNRDALVFPRFRRFPRQCSLRADGTSATLAAGASTTLSVTTSTTVAGRGSGKLRLGLSGMSWLYRDYSFHVDEAPQVPGAPTGRRSPPAGSTSPGRASTTTTNLRRLRRVPLQRRRLHQAHGDASGRADLQRHRDRRRDGVHVQGPRGLERRARARQPRQHRRQRHGRRNRARPGDVDHACQRRR